MITREEYIAKLLANNKQKDENWVHPFMKEEEKIVNTVIESITNLIENVDKRRFYDLTMVETRVVNNSELFNEKLVELRQKYDFLEIRVIKFSDYRGGLIQLNRIRVAWYLKEERK